MAEEDGGNAQFWVMINGQVESCDFPGIDNLFCKFAFAAGPDWTMVEGAEEGISQISEKQGGAAREFVWNFPLNVTYKSTNAHGWPQLALSAYGLDLLGRDVVRGYGCCLVPVIPGRHTRTVPLFRPQSSSPIQQFSAWFMGQRPEFRDGRFVTRGEGREVTRVRSKGTVRIVLNVVVKDMAEFGYVAAATAPQSLQT
eukprot:TRINITY_DN608_c1_g3_i1.p2 TRINITY_DN608_c1_g3~~TRINITY_DN608_c1_g3_i1.p2  ORF type:complete len:198 (-),score=82.96 TRINITY_DN608_c1_g3_i1:131-724(-)